MGFDRNQLVESLRNRMQNEGTVAYYLLSDNRFRVSSGYLGAEFQESMDSSFNQMHPSEVTSPVLGHRIPSYMDNPDVVLRPQLPVERKWALGLQSTDKLEIKFRITDGSDIAPKVILLPLALHH